LNDTAVRNALTFLLEIAGLHVRLCASLAATLAVAAGGRCGCIVLDAHMSAIDAARLLEELQRRTLNIPVIVLGPGLDRVSHDRSIWASAHLVLDFPIVDRSLLEAVLSACKKTDGCPQ
jgi:FixJ family two-component response regulator